MQKVLMALAALVCAASVSCNENQPPADSRAAEASHVSVQSKPPVQPVAMSRGGMAAAPAVANAPPENAQWTIYCDRFQGPGHVEIASRVKNDLQNQPRLHDWYLVHHEEDSTLFYGYYSEVDSTRGRLDKKAIDEMMTASGERRFRAQFVPLSSPDPDSPPQWNLENTPPQDFWSLQIAAFRGTADRKQRAVEAVKEARAAGIEAYYYHGETISSVCIGAWPKTAVRQQGEDNVARTASPDTPLMVVSDKLPPNVSPEMHDAQGNKVQLFAPKLDIDDPSLLAAVKQYPDHAVNGFVYERKDGNGKSIPSPSFLVQIPHRDPLAEENAATGQQGDRSAAPAATGGNDSTLGQLRTLGEH